MQTLFSKVDGGSVWYLVTRGSEGVTVVTATSCYSDLSSKNPRICHRAAAGLAVDLTRDRIQTPNVAVESDTCSSMLIPSATRLFPMLRRQRLRPVHRPAFDRRTPAYCRNNGDRAFRRLHIESNPPNSKKTLHVLSISYYQYMYGKLYDLISNELVASRSNNTYSVLS